MRLWSGRSSLGRSGRRNRERAEAALELCGVKLGAGGQPSVGREFEVPLLRPVGQQAEDFVEVPLWVEAMKSTRRP